ncbi:DnaJ domain protein [Aspergillus undulatus]|uniref:DnaJ domain protein n=1 Tax=Aspergillus undulatus TaxID=1810928 RepID=UPI003CCDD23B
MNCYEILGISSDASIKDIDSAYRRLALKHHPDKVEGEDAALEFQKIREAVETLRDPTTRAVHDRQLNQNRRAHRPYTKEEILFNSPDYTGWRPNSMQRTPSHFSRRDRYMFSFGESVHMKPNSADSKEELARHNKQREEEAENTLRTAEVAGRKRWKFTWNPEAENFKGSEYREPYAEGTHKNPQEPVWWAGARPEGDSHDVFGADSGAGNSATVEAGFDSKMNAEAELGPESEPDIQSNSDGNDAAEAEPAINLEAADVNTALVVPNADTDAESEVEPAVIIEPGPEYHAEFDIQDIIDSWAKKGNADIGSNAATEDNEADTEAHADVDSATADYASVHTVSSNKPVAEASSAPRWHPTFSMTSNTLSSPCSPAKAKADTASTANAEQESSDSIYYDFSDVDAAQSQPTHNESEVYHDFFSGNGTENENGENTVANASVSASASTTSSSPLLYGLCSDEAGVYPYLAPFVPYFTAKLADKQGRYTKDDFHGELKGMVMETYCGWLESVRVMISGAAVSKSKSEPANISFSNAQECRHLGYWTKEYEQEYCGWCGLWTPIYTLVCPGCGIGKCVRCKFEDAAGK